MFNIGDIIVGKASGNRYIILDIKGHQLYCHRLKDSRKSWIERYNVTTSEDKSLTDQEFASYIKE
jgi:hypothetical protein